MIAPRRFFLLALPFRAIAAATHAPAAEDSMRMGFHDKATLDRVRAGVQVAPGFRTEKLGSNFNVSTRVRCHEGMRPPCRDFDRALVNFVITSLMDFVRYFRFDERVSATGLLPFPSLNREYEGLLGEISRERRAR